MAWRVDGSRAALMERSFMQRATLAPKATLVRCGRARSTSWSTSVATSMAAAVAEAAVVTGGTHVI